MEEIIGMLQALKEDKPNVIITDDIIKDYIAEYLDILVEEIRNEVN